MDPALAAAPRPNPVVFEDGLGKRRQTTDPGGADALDLLCLNSELTAVPSFEFALRERVSRLGSFRHPYFARVRSVDRLNDREATLAIVSDATQGTRLSDVLAGVERHNIPIDINAALCLLRQLVPAIAMLHAHQRDAVHGALAPERIIITPRARLVIVEYVMGAALEQLRYSHARYWSDLRIALPRSAGLPRFDHRVDVTQIGLVALSLILGRQIREDEYPARLPELVGSAEATSPRGDREAMPASLRSWLVRALQIDLRTAFTTASEAGDELDRLLAADTDYTAEPGSLEAFLARFTAAMPPVAPHVEAPKATRTEPQPAIRAEREPAPPAQVEPAVPVQKFAYTPNFGTPVPTRVEPPGPVRVEPPTASRRAEPAAPRRVEPVAPSHRAEPVAPAHRPAPIAPPHRNDPATAPRQPEPIAAPRRVEPPTPPRLEPVAASHRVDPAPPPHRSEPVAPPRRVEPATPPQRGEPAAPHRVEPVTPPRRVEPATPPQRVDPAAPPHRLEPVAPPRRIAPAPAPQRMEPIAPIPPAPRREPIAPPHRIDPIAPPQRVDPPTLPRVEPHAPAKIVASPPASAPPIAARSEPSKNFDLGDLNNFDKEFSFNRGAKPIREIGFAQEYGTVEPEELDFDPPVSRGSRRWTLVAAALGLLAVAGGGLYASRRFGGSAAAVPATGTLSVMTNPAGAQVLIDGQAKGATPLALTLNAGNHTLELRGAGEPRTLAINVAAGSQASQYIELPKTVATSGQLQVRTDPPGATVTVDNIPHGTAPMTIADLPVGEHTVVLTSDGGSVTQKVTLEAGTTASLVVPMASRETAPLSGWISVSAPVEVQLFENGRMLGTSQTDRIMIAAGTHQIDIVSEALGYRVTRSVQVTPGKVSPLAIKLPVGTVALNAIPWAEVFIDGQKVGETPLGNLSVPIGPHEIVFKHPELGEQRHAATITLAAPLRLSVDLRKK